MTARSRCDVRPASWRCKEPGTKMFSSLVFVFLSPWFVFTSLLRDTRALWAFRPFASSKSFIDHERPGVLKKKAPVKTPFKNVSAVVDTCRSILTFWHLAWNSVFPCFLFFTLLKQKFCHVVRNKRSRLVHLVETINVVTVFVCNLWLWFRFGKAGLVE